MDDIFKSKEDMEREEKINNLFKSAGDFKKAEPEMVPVEELASTAEPEKKNPKVFLGLLVCLLFLVLFSAAGYLFWQTKKTPAISQSVPDTSEVEIVAEKVQALTELPSGKPSLMTITDREKFSEQSFFTTALDGDQILLYIQAQKAILYRPSSNEIIGTASLLFNKSIETAETSSAENVEKIPEKIATKVKVDVLNGTEIKGLAKETSAKLAGVENVELAKVGNAQKSGYTKILVVDLSGKNETAAKIIAQKLDGEVETLPEGETKGTADILVIAGKL